VKKENFYPLTLTRDIGDLRCGAATVAEHKRKPKYIWDLIVNLKRDLEKDLGVLGSRVKGQVHPSVVIYAPENVLIEEGAVVEACAVLDASAGSIYIGKGTIVRPNSYLRGPLFIGPQCRIGGEVVHSIFHGYSNKAYYGFIGHSYIGEWVNLGAGTTNSNLKNNYGTVKVLVNGKEIDSGEQFLGCFIADFARTGIGTLINTGSVIGVGANVFCGGLTPKSIPNFAWGEGQKYEWSKFIADVRKMMARRGKKLSKEQEKRLQGLYKL
jgi:hypothetical protein